MKWFRWLGNRSPPAISLAAVGAISLWCIAVHSPTAEAFDVLFGYNKSEYWKLPQLHVYDSFESCLHNHPHGVFCVAKVVIKPNSRSEIWRLIEKYSKYTFQYNHDVLTRGVCLERCSSVLAKLKESGVPVDRYLEPKFNVSKRYAMSGWMLPNASHYRQQYGDLFNACQNYELRRRYNLSGYVEIEECRTNESLTRPLDAFDVSFFTVLAALFILTVCSQCYDSWLAKNSTDAANHYRTPLEGRGSTLATAFSIRRNWAKLTYQSNRCQYQQDLDFVDQLRVLTMCLILLLHVFIGMAMFTAQNPLQMEQFSAHPVSQMLFSVVPFQVDLFFGISGLLMVVQFLHHTENKRFRLAMFWKGLINRYVRSLPLYAVLMLFTVSRNDTFQTTPSAYKILPTMRRICRRKWWSNLLFINNYYQPEEQCLIHTWYLAADFQLFVVGLLVMTLLWRFPRFTLWMAGLLGLLGCVLPMVNTYIHAIDAIMPLTMKGSEYQLWYDEHFVKSYQATETHCSSYFAGMIAGLLYHKITRKEMTLSNATLRNVFTLAGISIVACALQAPLYNMVQFSKPSAWMAILSGVHKVSIATFYSTAFLRLTFHDRESAVRRWFTGNGLSRAMARLGFGFYLVQMTVLKIVFSNYPEDTRINLQLIVSTFCSTFLLSYAIALVAFIVVEKPFDVLFKLMLGGGSRRDRPIPATPAKQTNCSPPIISTVLGDNGSKPKERPEINGDIARESCQHGREG